MNRVFIIAEIGINANGNLETAKELILGAKNCGADAIKFQKRTIEKVYSTEELDKSRESPWGGTNREQKYGLEFNEEEYDEIVRYCKEMKIEFMCSAWDLNSIKFLEKYDLKYNKIASALLTHLELCETIAKQGKYTFISTGMSTIEEITKIVLLFRKYACPIEIMHCNSEYPTPLENLNLLCIPYLQKLYNCNVGLSDHSSEVIVPAYAVALGATSIEKHITLDRAMYGSDQAASLALAGFQKMVDYVRIAEEIMGNGIKKVTEGELKVRAKLSRTKDYNL